MLMDHIFEGLTNFGCCYIRPKQVLCSGLLERQTITITYISGKIISHPWPIIIIVLRDGKS